MHYIAVIIGISWIIFWLYWIISALGSKKSRGPQHLRQFIGIRIVLIVLTALLTLLFNHLHQSFKSLYIGTQGVVLGMGLVVFFLGVGIAIWARVYLGKNWGMPMTQKQNPEIVTSGPYSYIRHPIYSGIILMTLGSAIDVNIYWLLVFIVAVLYFVFCAFSEERLLMKQFPKIYPAYKEKSKMLIPFIF